MNSKTTHNNSTIYKNFIISDNKLLKTEMYITGCAKHKIK